MKPSSCSNTILFVIIGELFVVPCLWLATDRCCRSFAALLQLLFQFRPFCSTLMEPSATLTLSIMWLSRSCFLRYGFLNQTAVHSFAPFYSKRHALIDQMALCIRRLGTTTVCR